ncbi:MAG: fibrillarin-like rRNA/tRNA 2'-O-methyltransferase [Candidatus Methanomethylophilaceae archaeon]|nr:fibrillarin-like rRNA/tRNA 2'-O-methyltransferase [Candidatus Methanomethylophilaceae archaeon]
MEPLQGTDGTVFSNRGRLYTISRDPGKRVYGERLVSVGGIEYREWSATRSKLSAYLSAGGKSYPLKKDSKVLYLGAANGTTVSHVSDIACDGTVHSVEFSPRSFRDLVKLSESRDNVIPILADATRPDEYSFAVDKVDIVYSDVAQKNQADILADNMNRYGARYGMVCIKARSEDVTASPESIFEMSKKRLIERGMKILDLRSLEPFEKDHAMIVVERPRTAYCVAFEGEKFLMVYNTRRKGWEMPGGKLETGETSEEAAKRECLEESGYEIEIVSTRDIGYCDVCSARIVSKKGDGEMRAELFKSIPDELAFDRSEYETVVPWARGTL